MTAGDYWDIGLSILGDASMVGFGALLGRAGKGVKKISDSVIKKIKPETGISNDAKALLDGFDKSNEYLDKNIKSALDNP